MRTQMNVAGILFVFILSALTRPASGEEWMRFRGPNGSGYLADAGTLPVEFGPDKNLKWKVAIPGPGSSSPILVGDRVFVTCWTGYGMSRQGEPGDPSQLKRHLLCFDRATGKLIWQQDIQAELPEDEYGGMFAEHGYASHTPVSDGEHVYVFFGKSGAFAFTLDGKLLWQKNLGKESDPRDWGSASSPVLFKNLLIVTAAAESEAIVALDKNSGEEVWRQEAKGFSGTWGTPILVDINAERTDLVIGVPYEIWGLNPENGKLRWYCEAMDTNSYCSSVVTEKGIVYGIEGRGGGSIAVRAGGEGDVTKENVVWSGRDNNRIGTPLLFDGRLYFFSGGVANCIDCKDGSEVFQARLALPDGEAAEPGRGQARGGQGGRGGPGGGRGFRNADYSSAVAGDGKIYFASRGGNIFVLKLSPEFEQLAVNRVTTEEEDFSATPAISGGNLFIRSDKHLYCVGSN
jgi:outer membrane protein assembly factor BamB